MRRIITFFLLFLSVFGVYGAARCDSVKVYFALNEATYDPAFDNNASSMENFIDGIVAAANSGKLDHIVIYGYASPEGPYANNDNLAARRCRVIADYISRHAGIHLADIHTSPEGIAWEGLRALVRDNLNTPSRTAVLRVLDEYIPAIRTDHDLSDQCRNKLMAIDNGHAYQWMVENLFPKLRFSLTVYTSNAPESSIVHPALEKVGSETSDSSNSFDSSDSFISADTRNTLTGTPESSVDSLHFIQENIDPDSLRPLHRLALKTNLLYYAILLPNLELEWRINNNWSVALEGDIAWWGKPSKEKSYRLAIVSPEVKRWIRPRAPWHGFYIGAFVGGGLYDLENTTKGYYGEGVMGGLSFGFMWPVSRSLSLEAGIGAGYLYSRYKEYKPMDGHHVYQRTKDLNYFGPLKVKFSLVWRLWDLNNSKRLDSNIRNYRAK